MKLYKLLLPLLLFSSCVGYKEREDSLKSQYPKNVISLATTLLTNQGFEFLMEDTIANQIYAVSFYPFSATKINNIRNIK